MEPLKYCVDGYVSSESGTGIVHQAPYFGEDDFRISLSYGIVTRDEAPICPWMMLGGSSTL